MNGFTSGGSSIALAQQVLLALTFLAGSIAFVALAVAIVRHFVGRDAHETVQPLVSKMWRICGTMAGIAILAGSGFTATKAILNGTEGQQELQSGNNASGQDAFMPSNDAWHPGALKDETVDVRANAPHAVDGTAESTAEIMNNQDSSVNVMNNDWQNEDMAALSNNINKKHETGWTEETDRAQNAGTYAIGDFLAGIRDWFSLIPGNQKPEDR